MTKTLEILKALPTFPKDLRDNVMYLAQTGSVSYGASNDVSDFDVVGFLLPRKEDCFPHTAGHIYDFGEPPQTFQQYQHHHYKLDEREYDFTVYSIIKFFNLCMQNNPNMIDTLFVPQRCVLFCSKTAQRVRDNRKIFLHKGSYHKFRGYAYAQLSKIGSKANSSNPKRQKSIDEHGFDVKFAYHVVRLALEAEQILVQHDLNIEANSEILKSIRRGEWSLEKIQQWFDNKERVLEELYATSTLRHNADEVAIRQLLLECLEDHYGTVSNFIQIGQSGDGVVKEILDILQKNGYSI